MNGGRALDDGARSRDSRLAAGIRRRWRWVFWPTLAAALGSSAFVLIASPRYTGVAKVLLDEQAGFFTQPEKSSRLGPAEMIDPDAGQSRADVVATADLARKAIDKLGLQNNSEFNPSMAAERDGKTDQRVVDKFLSRLTAFRAPRSRVLQIEFVSRDPELAARGANAVAEVLLQSQTEAKANAARTASASLAGEIGNLRAQVADADAKVETFRAQSGLLAGAKGQTVPAQQLSDLNARLANARSAEAAATAKVELLQKLERAGRHDEAPASITDESLRRFSEQRVALRAQIAEAARTLLPLHPRMKELAAQLAGLDGQIRDAAARNVRELQNDARLAASQVASLTATLAEQSKTVEASNADDARLRALEMEAKAARDQLESYLQKYREAAARDVDGAAPANARTIATGEPPRTPAFPRAWQTILLATLATFVSSTGVAAAATLVSDEPERRDALAAPALALTASSAPAPSLESSEERSTEPGPRPSEPSGRVEIAALDAPQALADRLAALMQDGRLTTLVAGTGSGRSLAIALETARRLSRESGALLVDLGATQDWFADILAREETDGVDVPGLANLLAGKASYSDIIRRDLTSTLDVIPSGGDVSDEALADVFAAIASAYDCVVLHASDWRSGPARAAAEAVDAVIVVAPRAWLPRVIEDASEGLGDACPQILPFAERSPKAALEQVA
jgi:polysaccharide biosynthesis transport protein